MKTFTAAAIHCFIYDEEMPAIVAEGFRLDAEPDRRRLRFACLLADRWDQLFGIRAFAGDSAEPVEPKTALLRDVLELASVRVSWGRVARELEKHFTTPARLAMPAECPYRLTSALSGWHGPVN
jgi:hypothetical protein